MDYVLMFLAISILSSLGCKNSAIEMIERIKTNSRRFPKGYTTTPKWVRARFKIKQRVIPRYLYFELILSIIYALMCPINLIICVAVDFSPYIVVVLVMIHSCLIIIDRISFIILSFCHRS